MSIDERITKLENLVNALIAKVDNIIRAGGRVISCSNKVYKVYCVVWALALKHRRRILRILKKLRKW